MNDKNDRELVKIWAEIDDIDEQEALRRFKAALNEAFPFDSGESGESSGS